MAINTDKVQQQAADLSSQLWSIANDLRGGMDANEFRNYILGTIFYRYLSERTEMYMQEILQEDNLTYEEAFANDDFRPIKLFLLCLLILFVLYKMKNFLQ